MNRLQRILFLVLLMGVPCCAQYDTADVVGTITDASGAAIPEATITLKNTATGIVATTTSSPTGEYTIVNVKAGSYQLMADKAGFSRATVTNVLVEVGARRRVDLTLHPGAVTQTVEVSEATSTIETDSSSRGEVIQTQQVTELPLNGRNASDLSLLTTGVIRSPQSTNAAREGAFIVNGLRATYSNYLLDGVDNNAYGTSNNGASNQAIQVSPDAIMEFKVDANNYTAEFGRGGAATTNVVMKSGTNAVHGSAYEFLRNTAFNAVGFFQPTGGIKPPLHQNQFGLTIGGPFLKDRLFYFGDYEGFRVKSGALTFSSVPSATELQGILSATVTNPQTGITYPAGTQIPSSAMAPYAVKMLSQFPSPTVAGAVANNYQRIVVTDQNTDKYDAKIDDQINTSMSAFLRISQRKLTQFANPGVPGPNYNEGGHTRVLDQQAVLGYVWTVNSSSVLDARFAVTRINAGGGPQVIGTAGAETYGIPGLPTTPINLGGYNIGDGGLPSMALSPPFTAFGRGTATPQFQNPLGFDSKVSLTKILGKQTLKFGVEWMVLREQVLDINPFYGKFSFLGNFSGTGNAREDSLADFFFGLPSQMVLSNADVPNQRKHFYYLYGQDDIRVNSKLTLNLGLRWEYGSPWYERDNKMANFDPATGGFIYAKAGGVYDRSLLHPQLKDYAPRVGFAWSVLPKTVVHGGFSYSYVHDHRVGSAEELGIFGPFGPVWTLNQTNPTAPSFLTVQKGFPTNVATPANFNPILANSTYIPPNIPDTYIQTWMLNVQRQLPYEFVLDVGYVGNHSVADPLMVDYNQALPQPTSTSNLSLQARRPFQTAGAVTCYCPAGFSNYNGLQARLEKKASHGITVVDAFTYSHTIDNGDQSLDFSNGAQASPQNYRNMKSEHGTSNYDRKFVNVLSAVADIPVGKGRHYLANAPTVLNGIVGDWQFDIIATDQSALPVNLRSWTGLNVPTLFQTVGNLNDWRGGETYRPNCTPGPVSSYYGTGAGRLGINTPYFNTTTVTLQADPSQPFGTCGRDTMRAPGYNQFDTALHKSFSLPERMSLVFRAEYFDVLNHTNLQAPNPDRASGAFGLITSALPARIGQFALKLTW